MLNNRAAKLKEKHYKHLEKRYKHLLFDELTAGVKVDTIRIFLYYNELQRMPASRFQNIKYFLTPSIVVFEVYKQLKKKKSEEKALEAIGLIIAHTKLIGITADIAIEASETDLGMADAIINTVADLNNANIVSSDRHFKGFKNTIFIG